VCQILKEIALLLHNWSERTNYYVQSVWGFTAWFLCVFEALFWF